MNKTTKMFTPSERTGHVVSEIDDGRHTNPNTNSIRMNKTSDDENGESAESIGSADELDLSETDDSQLSTTACTATTHLTKTEKKQKRFREKIAKLKAAKKQLQAEKKAARANQDENSPTSEHVFAAGSCSKKLNRTRENKQLIRERQEEGRRTGQRICIDLGLEQHMSRKECSLLAQQLQRLYGSNRCSESPAHVYFCGLIRESFLYQECVRKNAGFESYIVDMSEQSALGLFKSEEIVYLSPDSPNVLEDVDPGNVYLIGGLVDESVTKNITYQKATSTNIKTARFPIEEYMDRIPVGNHSKVLSVNQVFDILMEFKRTQDWKIALPVGVAQRKGFIVKS